MSSYINILQPFNTIKHIYVFILLISCTGFVSANTVQVSTISRQPFSYGMEADPKGFSIQLREHIAEKIDITTQYTIHTSFSDMLDSVKNSTTDLAVANISITAEREEYLDFSYPIYDSGLQFLGIRESLHHAFLKDRKNQLLIFIFTALFLLSFMLKTSRLSSLLRGISIIILIGGIGYLYQNRKTSGITVQNYKDIGTQRVGTSIGTTMSAFLDTKGIDYKKYSDFNHALQGLEDNEIDIVLGDAAVVQYYVKHIAPQKFMLIGNIFASDKLAFAFPEGSPLVEEVNTLLLEAKEDGTYEKLKNIYFK